MNNKFAIAALAAALLVVGNARAAEEDSPWAGNVSFGYLASTGNTETESINAEARAAYSVDGWVHNGFLSALGSSDSGTTTNERYQAQYKLDKNLSEKTYLFGRLAYDKDRFSGFDHKESATVGLGRRLIENEKHLLKGEAGAGSRREELDDGTSNTNAIFLGNLDYRYTISENAEFTQTLLVEMGKDNDYMESITKLKANIVGNLAVAVSYTVKNNSNPPPANEKTDTYTAISLEYKF
jgi:putative salt-induced outer membrane protein